MNLPLAQLPAPPAPGTANPAPGTPPPQAEDIRDIVAPAPLPDYLEIALMALLASLFVFLLAYAVILTLRRRRRRLASAAPPPSPSQLACAALDDLQAESPGLSPNDIAVAISNIVKRYFHDRYDDPILFETSEEFTLRENHRKSIPHSKQVALRGFFKRCDQLKYARFPDAAAETGVILEAAADLVSEPAVPEAAVADTQYVTSS